ncbi:MAG: diguanylate cyclase, partial [Lachnospiraceae bacterium]|nr:diguanylate cyclase [Lachnospiraceae bacterium]
SSFDEIKGRTAEEVGWNHGDTKPIDMEYEILTKGTRFIDVPGKIIAKGKVRDTLYSMIPLYQGEKIVGLAGYFDDVEDKLAKIDERNAALRIDSVTGIMNSRAFVDEMIDRADMYNESGTDYGLIVLNNTTHWRIVETYGQEFADKVLHCMADTIVKTAGRGAAVSRTKEAVFVVMCGIKDRDGFISLAEKIKKALSAIIEVEGNRVTMRIKLSAKIRSEESTYDEAIYELALKDVM